MVQTTAKRLKNRLRRADGQLQGILKMVDEGCDCQEIPIQLAAVWLGVERIMGVVVAEYVRQCVVDGDVVDRWTASSAAISVRLSC